MSYIPYAKEEQSRLLDRLGLSSAERLFDDIPAAARTEGISGLPDAMDEQSLWAHITALAAQNDTRAAFFVGAGLYDHYIPAAVAGLVARSEFLTAYTPYQPEISQGTLMAIFEFQTHISRLTGLDVANASQYDGASAAAEAMLMAAAQTRKSRVVVSRATHPETRRVLRTYARFQGVEVAEADYDEKGRSLSGIERMLTPDTAAVVAQSPNFFGVIEPMGNIAAAAHDKKALAVAVCDPLSLAVLTPPGENGFDIAAGECQPLGLPVSFGGPHAGYLAAREAFLRRMPGRIVGQTADSRGGRAFVLTMQAREQHIRREKATSNICSNQALCALTATVYLSLMGPRGLRAAAALSASHAGELRRELTTKCNFTQIFDAPFFRECVLKPTDGRDYGLGYRLGRDYPELGDAVLVAATEKDNAARRARVYERQGVPV